MSNIVDLLGRPFTPPEQPRPEPPEVQLRQAITDAGLTPPERVVIDGTMHRFSSDGRPKDDSGWYVAFPGTIPGGQFGCWRTGLSVPWRADIGRDLTPAEHIVMTRHAAEARKLREAEQARRRESAADTAEAIWEKATPASDDHPYLMKKGVMAHGLRTTGDGRLVCPMRTPDGELSSLQFIDAEGEKRFLSGGKVTGAFYAIGEPSGTIYVCEGVATAHTIFEATGRAVLAAYSAGNLSAVARHASTLGQVVVVADNDLSGTGQLEAEKTGCRVVMPPVEGMDVNDYAQAGGDVAALLAPPDVGGYLIAADEFAGQPAPIRWLIKRWIQRDALHMVHGPSGGGKTFVVLDMILSAAAGLSEWCGHRVTTCPVVYLAGEGHHGLRARIAGWKAKRGADHLQAWVSRAGDDLNTPGGLGRVQEAIRALPDRPAIIVVDTLHRFLNGDENSAQDAKTMLDACALLQSEFGAAVILVHHTGVSDEAQHRARGSSAWRGALDIEISVVPGTDSKPLEIVQRKSKDAELSKSIFATLIKVELPWIDEDGEQVTTAVLSEADAPAVTNSDAATAEARKRLEEAIIHSGAVMPDGHLFITAYAWREHGRDMPDKNGNRPSADTAKKRHQRDKKLAIEAGIVTEYHDGYVLAPGHDRDVLALLMRKK